MEEVSAMTITEKDYNPKAFTPPKERFLYRVKFTKGEEVKFIGHLDIMRLFQRAIKRAKLPVAYSQGFNPHQLLSFASPLTLGTTSEGEYGDFEMARKINPQILVDGLNEVLPKGVRVISAVPMNNQAEKAMAAMAGAEYIIYPEESMTPDIIEAHLDGFLKQKEIIMMKKTKKDTKPTDIRQDIFAMKHISDGKETKIYVFLAAGSQRNLKPSLVMEAFYQYVGLEFFPYRIKYHRLELYRKDGDTLVPLSEGISDGNGAEPV